MEDEISEIKPILAIIFMGGVFLWATWMAKHLYLNSPLGTVIWVILFIGSAGLLIIGIILFIDWVKTIFFGNSL